MVCPKGTAVGQELASGEVIQGLDHKWYNTTSVTLGC
jgi:hypothetical protein